jgi:hypothetical protein
MLVAAAFILTISSLALAGYILLALATASLLFRK